MSTEYEPVIGLEVHAQLFTRTKIFCGCSAAFGAEPNTHTCPTCLGLPGALPVLNGEAVRLAVRAALGVGCTIRTTSRFARKNYFYPDLPKGYQISQFDEPYSDEGFLELELGEGDSKYVRRARIQRVHMEEDAGKNMHDRGDESIVDLNRSGTPLVEIVGHPDLRSPAEAAEYLRVLRDLLVFLGVNDGNLEEGSFRCDANVSIRPKGTETLGTRVELKNINSFKFVEKAIAHEIVRQESVLGSGGRIVQETRGWSEKDGKTFSLRSKETAQDYRYFPEPDLPPLHL
ncbi:MAG TPA: Asp-tRNA(Asn)/Glu-tRNA(Gln) amidotransferase subunit GatB, partial [Polyangiaceae bacterium]